MEETSPGGQLTDRTIERRRRPPDPIEPLPHLESASFDLVGPEAPPSTTFGGVQRIDGGADAGQLRRDLDLARLKLYAAVDQVRGAEAAEAAALGRVADFEYQLHLKEVEIDSLKSELDTVRAEASSLRLLAARRARDTLLRSLGSKVDGAS